jgi:hypothetical protein
MRIMDERHAQDIVELIEPLVRREFARVKAKNPKLKRILFGNGTYLLDGIQDLIQKSYTHANISGSIYCTAKMPKYMERLYELCERVKGWPIADIE